MLQRLGEVKLSPGEIKRREVELGSHSWMEWRVLLLNWQQLIHRTLSLSVIGIFETGVTSKTWRK